MAATPPDPPPAPTLEGALRAAAVLCAVAGGVAGMAVGALLSVVGAGAHLVVSSGGEHYLPGGLFAFAGALAAALSAPLMMTSRRRFDGVAVLVCGTALNAVMPFALGVWGLALVPLMLLGPGCAAAFALLARDNR